MMKKNNNNLHNEIIDDIDEELEIVENKLYNQ